MNDYLAWLESHYLVVAPRGEFNESLDAYGGYYITHVAAPNSDPVVELAKYNALDRSIDPGWAQQFMRLNQYFTNGEFAPGAPTATLEVMAQAEAQWARDAEPGLLEKVMKAAFIAATVYVAGGAAGLWGTAAETGIISMTAAEELAMLGIPATEANISIAAIVEAAPLTDYSAYVAFDPVAADVVLVTTPEIVQAAAAVATNTATAVQAATVANTGLSATQIISGAKTVMGVASTVKTIAAMVGATNTNPADGPFGLPPGYQPTVTPGGPSQDINYSGIISQLALPAAGLLALFLLKG